MPKLDLTLGRLPFLGLDPDPEVLGTSLDIYAAGTGVWVSVGKTLGTAHFAFGGDGAGSLHSLLLLSQVRLQWSMVGGAARVPAEGGLGFDHSSTFHNIKRGIPSFETII